MKLFSADTETALLPNIHTGLVHPTGKVWQEKSLVSQIRGLNTIAPEVLGGYALH
jgi:hypothetical protein